MKIMEILERAGIDKTGQGIFWIKDALQEMNILSETHVKTERIDIVAGQRFYNLPNDAIRILDIRCKDHNNTSGDYQSIPRSTHEPKIEDSDGI
tara:strand:+ start:769 stop:1050 length:282 start_codon:yes stop_codon:yes gene_type:complete